jgi:hypothetical protein
MSGSSELPRRGATLTGRDADGRPVELVRSVARKLYRCPCCGGEIEIGEDHILVRYPERDASGYTHHHWHAECARELLLPQLTRIHRA